MDHAYWDPHFTNAQIATLLGARTAEVLAECIHDEARLCSETAARGEVVGCLQGRMEWGPCALIPAVAQSTAPPACKPSARTPTCVATR